MVADCIYAPKLERGRKIKLKTHLIVIVCSVFVLNIEGSWYHSSSQSHI